MFKPSQLISFGVIFVVTAFLLASCDRSFLPTTNPTDINTSIKQTSYQTVTEIFDWGAAITKVIVCLDTPIKQGSVCTDTFKVFVSRSDDRITPHLIEEDYRTITKAYISDKEGKESTVGEFATLELEIGPNISLSSTINYYKDFNTLIDYNYTVTQVKDIYSDSYKISGLVADKCAGEIKNLIDNFSIGESSYDDITLTYASYTPEEDKNKNPLIIWLHGWGEGGTDATLLIHANKSANFSSKEIQANFGGAYVLLPQAKTYWMQGRTTISDGTSIYESALMSFIKDYVSKNEDIDQNRVYIGGCSSGGYMTMLMIRDYPEYFAAAFPVCEGLIDILVSNKNIQKMKEFPIWFTSSKTDKTLNHKFFTTPTYERLIKAGAKNVYYTLFDDVRDTSGLYKNPDGTPYEYDGHFSWIYVFNNECKETINGKTTTIMEWLASMSLDKR